MDTNDLMAQLKEIFELEVGRVERGDFSTIFLVQEGTFYRAYEWSAWLCCRYINSFKVTRREDKQKLTVDGTLTFIGFPITSLNKYVPDAWEIKTIGEKVISAILPKDVFDPLQSGVSLTEDFAHWKQSLPMAAERKQSLRDGLKSNSPEEKGIHRMSDVLSQIMSYPIEQKSPMECMLFLADLKKQIAAML